MSERPVNSHPREPADLPGLAETDALLDRLAGRRPSEEDFSDPAVMLLTGLTAAVDEGPDADQDVSRLIEVLAGRPLFFGAEDAADDSEVTAADRPIELAPSPAVPTVAAHDTRVIDLTDHAPVAPAEQLPNDGPAVPRTGAGEAEVVLISHWRKAIRNVSVPAAAAVALIALGSGVSAVVTGNPMAPVNGVSRVMSQLPGTSDNAPQSKLAKAQAEINAANLAAGHNDSVGAKNHLAAAQSVLADVPAAQKAGLTTAIAQIQTAIATGTPPPTPIIGTTPPPVGVSTPPPATVAPTTPAGEPTPTDTGGAGPTTPPTTDSPATTPPTTPPTSPESDPATSPAVADTTPAADAPENP
jgi:hypothetical protein